MIVKSLVWLGVSFLLSTSSQAALGERASSSARRLNADPSQTSAVYTTQQTTSDSGDLKEYVNAAGVVFAMTWRGLDHPDFSEVLGHYFAQYKKAEKGRVRKHGVRTQKTLSQNLVVEKWGHMRDFQGRAYDLSLIPSGVNLDEIL